MKVKVSITGYREWDKCGDEYLDGRDTELEFEVTEDSVVLTCEQKLFGSYGEIITLNKDDLVALLRVLTG